MESVLTPLAKSVLIPLGLSWGMSPADAVIQNKIYGLGHHSNLASRTTALIISNEEMEDIMKIIKSLEESGLLIKAISKKNKNEAKKTKNEVAFNVIRDISYWFIRKCISRKNSNIRAGQN